jgi:tight adherence protein C
VNPWRDQRRRQARAREFPDAIEFVVLGVRSGSSPTEAVRAAGRSAGETLAPAFDDFEHRLARGAGFADALVAFADHVGEPARSFVDTLATTERYGLPLAPALDRLVDDAREHRRRHSERVARRLPVTMAFPLVVCILPSFVLLAVVPGVIGALHALRGSMP